MSKLDEQFDVLCNTLRLLPEEILRLNYFVKEINDPEEGITNVEVTCVNVFNNIYGMMCALKDQGVVTSIYDNEAVTSVLCIRHILQHQSGRLRNNLRDAFFGQLEGSPVLVKYNISDPNMPDPPLYISAVWLQEGIANSNNSKRLSSINDFWRLDQIKQQVESASHGSWGSTYICVLALITEAVRTILVKYGSSFSATGFDSRVYYDHFREIVPINPADYGIIT
jgi:hypothetical protein